MSKGAWTASAADSVAIPADVYRGEINLQLTGNGPVFIGFGEPAVAGEGMFLSAGMASITVNDHRARLAIHMICGAGSTGEGTYQTA